MNDSLDSLPASRPPARAAEALPLTHFFLHENEELRAQLAASEAAYRAVFDGALDAMLLADDAGRYVDANAAASALFGASRESLRGKRVSDLAPPGFDFRAAWQELTSGGSMSAELRVVRPDGSRAVLELTAKARVLPGRHLIVLRDVTAQRKAEDALRLSEDLFAKAFRMSPIPLGISTVADARFIDVNASCEELMGRRRDEVVGRTSDELALWADETHRERLIAAMRDGGLARGFETRLRRPSGEVREVLMATELIDVRGEPCVLGVVLDLTERKRAEAALRKTEEQLRQLQKLEAIGSLAGGIAHDFNNILSVILGLSTLILDTLAEGDPLRDDVDQIQAAAERAADLTRQLLAFSRRQVLEPRVSHVERLVAGMERMLRRVLGEHVELSILSRLRPGKILVDPGQFEQVLLNLAVNARDAMPNGGRLAIEMANVDLDHARAEDLGLAPGPYVLVAVSDTGMGMDAATRERMFEPFFTTKEKGRGTGLGLATAFGVMRQSGGAIGVHSEPGAGTTLELYFPRTDRPDEPEPRRSAAPPRPTGAETVLLVEDEAGVRQVLCNVLRKLGYTVLVAANAGEALLLCERHPGSIDLLLTDVVMPLMSGRALADRLVQMRPDMLVIFMSGYTDDAILHHGVLDAGVTFLQKPIGQDTLARKVRQVLDGRPLAAQLTSPPPRR